VSLYVHIPWCRVRCGYCDFNTYVADTSDPGVTSPYVCALLREMDLAARRIGRRRVETVYFGGGTPTLMPLADYARIMAAVRDRFDLSPDAEVTTEANPETVAPDVLEGLRNCGINRLSMGMQSAAPHVLATLDRAHTPGRVTQAVAWARTAGFEDVSLDLIYGTPGESMADWGQSVDAALALEPDHLSAYSLIVEEGTPMARRMAAGQLPYPDEDDLADKYLVADERFAAAGLEWYEVSNWARPGHECRHNMVYWRGGDWWGLGAGAHSHLAGRRWWNHRRPLTYEAALEGGQSPAAGSEHPTAEQTRVEMIMLGIRLSEGFDAALLTSTETARVEAYVAAGQMRRRGDRLICAKQGRLLADGIVREILD
jgi:oxygen-independent coproporphyrinogen-3 oxidase